MKKTLLPAILLMFIGCNADFNPDLKGWKAYTTPPNRLHLNTNGYESTIELPGNDKIRYRFAQWTKFQDHILLTQIRKTESCSDYQIVEVDTTGVITDTIYTAAPNTALNFKLAPNDSLLLLKTYSDNCDESDHYRYSFYNRYLRKALSDTIAVGDALGILLGETVWSPDSKKVIISRWSGSLEAAVAYDLVTKDTTYIDVGSNFTWSPSSLDLIGYIKDYSLYTKNIKTGENELVYEGKRKKSVTDFRWNPSGDFLMIHLRGYLLNIEATMFGSPTIVYLSMKDKLESRTFYDSQRIDTWKVHEQSN